MNDNSAKQPAIPLPSPELLYQVSRDSDQGNFLRSATGMVGALLENLSGCEVDFDKPLKFLDFGCGVGKVLIGLRDHPQLELYGCDLDEKLITWCSENLNAKCYKNDLNPPLKYADDTFDVINAVSVFTHLNLEMQFRWAWELYRVVKPGGYLHFTVHGPSYFGLFADVAKSRPITDLKIHNFEDAEMFMELEQPIHNELYDSKKGKEAQGQLEVAVAHTESMIRKFFSPFLLIRRIIHGSIGAGHDVYVLRKPFNGANLLLKPFDHNETIFHTTGAHWKTEFDVSKIGSSEGKIFRIFCSGGAPGIYFTKVGSKIRIKNNGKLVAEYKPMLSIGTRFFGDTQWRTIEVALPSNLNGKISFEMESFPEMKTYLKNMKWIAPQILTSDHQS